MIYDNWKGIQMNKISACCLWAKMCFFKKKEKSTKSSVGRNEVAVTAAALEESKANIHAELYLHPYRYSIS